MQPLYYKKSDFISYSYAQVNRGWRLFSSIFLCLNKMLPSFCDSFASPLWLLCISPSSARGELLFRSMLQCRFLRLRQFLPGRTGR